MSVIPSEYATCPFPSNSSVLLTTLAHVHNWWSYRQLCALQTNRTEGQFGHHPIYRPIISLSFTSPSLIQISSEHYFEWREVNSPLPLVAIHIIIHPSFAFAEPLFNIAGTLSQPDNWQTKFTHICQDISDIKSNNNSKLNKIGKITITPTNFRSTKVPDNHKLQGSYRNGEDDQDASDSPYKPSQEKTKHHNSDTRIGCDAPKYDASPTPPQPASLPPSYPESPLSPGIPLSPTASTASTSWKVDTAVPKEWTSLANTSVNGVLGPEEEEGVGGPPKAESNQQETTEVLGEGGPPDPGPRGGTSGPLEPPELEDLPAPNRTAERRNLIRETS